MAASFKVGKIEIGGGELFLIAGPCVIESEAHALKMAESITGVAKAMRLPYMFKASYDKANRTSLKSFRGLGIAAGLRILKRIKDEVKIPVLTDVHEAVDVPQVAEVADVLQIPAFLCGQPEFIPVLARAAVAVGVDGIFIEVHDDPKNAKSDGANVLDLKKLRGLLQELIAVWSAVNSP